MHDVIVVIRHSCGSVCLCRSLLPWSPGAELRCTFLFVFRYYKFVLNSMLLPFSPFCTDIPGDVTLDMYKSGGTRTIQFHR